MRFSGLGLELNGGVKVSIGMVRVMVSMGDG